MALSLARVLRFEAGTFAGHDREAYTILSHLAAMPLEMNHDRRRRYGIEILTNASSLMPLDQPQNTQFHQRLREQVISMQEYPAWYSTLRNSNEQIVNSFIRLWWVLKGMEVGGLGGLSGIPADMNKGALAGMQGKRGAAGRAAGAIRGGMAGAAGTVTGGLRGTAGIYWAIGSMLYVGGQDRLNELGNEITRRYQHGQLSAELYQKAFGEDGPVPEQFSGRRR